jgi:hypothetical protein
MRIGEQTFLILGLLLALVLMSIGVVGLVTSSGLVTLTGQSITDETTSLETFTKIEVLGNLPIEYTTSETSELSIQSPNPIEDLSIQVEVRDETLFITQQFPLFSNILRNTNRDIDSITISSPELQSIKIFSSGSFSSQTLSGQRLETEVNGSGSINLSNLSYETITSSISGSGDIILAGETQSYEANIFGSGTINAESLVADTVKSQISGSGDIITTATTDLQVFITGSGTVKYKGDPAIDQTITGSGSLQRI